MGFFLGVERSFTGRPWRPRLDAAGEARALAIAQVSGQSELMARVLAGRGVGLDEVARHLEPTLRELMPDPFALRDMEAATARLARAVQRGERVAIFGDYDVDGAASAALLSEYLEACGCPTLIHIPDRVAEGYGPNSEAKAAITTRLSSAESSSPSIAAR
jgi:single-stranded-DNA-specific exonuclease